MKPHFCSCCQLIYCQRIKKAWVCFECDRRPSVRECRTVEQYIEVVGLAHKFAEHTAKPHQKSFMEMACKPELDMLALRAKQLKNYKRKKGL